MKVDRDKRHRRFMHFYLQHFKLKHPFRIIMDYEFLEHLYNKKLGNVKELFPKLFDGKAYPMVTECMVREAKANSEHPKEVLKLMERFERAPCGHNQQKKSGEDCLRDIFAEPHYCLAGRSKWSLKLAYYYPHVPVLMWDLANVLVMRAPSESSKQAVEAQHESHRFHASDLERTLIKKAIEEEKRDRAEQNKLLSAKINYRLRFNHKPVAKGPHPLSVLKRQSTDEKKRTKPPKNAFQSFGGQINAKTENQVDLPFISRSKLRRKRKRSEIKSDTPLHGNGDMDIDSTTQIQEIPNDSQMPALLPADDSQTSSTPAKKIRKRRKPKFGDQNQHIIRETLREQDSQIEASLAS
jgi:rRNA-processing protein FCF1